MVNKSHKMKKIISALFLVFIISGAAKAQLEFGAKGGLNVSDVTNLNGSARVSGHLGLFAHKTLNDHWCVQPELLYSFEGQKYPTNNDAKLLALDYIQIPVMVQYYATKQFYLEFGPQLGFNTNARVKYDNGNKTEVDNQYTSAELAVNLGLGYMFTNQVGLYTRYVAGVTDISKNDNTTYNRVWQLGLQYRFK